MAELILPPSLQLDTRSRALLSLAERLGKLDLTPLLVYRLDSLVDAGLVFMAWQFDMLDPNWQLQPGIPSGSQSTVFRALLKQAIPLHKILGTPASIIAAIKSIGFDATLLEGQNSWGGTSWPSNEGWAVFRVLVTLPPGTPVTAEIIARIKSAANFFKPARCWLDSVVFNLGELGPDFPPLPVDSFSYQGEGVVVEMAPLPTEALSINLGEYQECYPTIAAVHSARYNHGGGIRYGQVPDGGEIILADGPLVITHADGYPSRVGAWVTDGDGIAKCVLPPSAGGFWGPPTPVAPSFSYGGTATPGVGVYSVTVSATLPSGYVVALAPNWNTSVWVTGKSTSGFTINFDVPAPSGAQIDWYLPTEDPAVTFEAIGTDSVSTGAYSHAVAFGGLGPAPSGSYKVTLTPSWNTTYWFEPGSKSTTGFTVNFNVPAPAGATLDWSAVIP